MIQWILQTYLISSVISLSPSSLDDGIPLIWQSTKGSSVVGDVEAVVRGECEMEDNAEMAAAVFEKYLNI